MGVTRESHALASKAHALLTSSTDWSYYPMLLGFDSWEAMRRSFNKRGLQATLAHIHELRRSQGGYVNELNSGATAKQEAHRARMEDLGFLLDNNTPYEELVERLGYHSEKDMWRSVRLSQSVELLEQLERSRLCAS